MYSTTSTKEIYMSYDLTQDASTGEMQLMETTDDYGMEQLIESFIFEIR